MAILVEPRAVVGELLRVHVETRPGEPPPGVVRILGEERVVRFPFDLRRRFFESSVALAQPTAGPVGRRQASFAIELPEDLPPTFWSPRRRISYWVQHGLSDLMSVDLVAKDDAIDPRPRAVVRDSGEFRGGGPRIEAYLASDTFFTGGRMTLRYRIHGDEYSLIRRMRAEWYDDSSARPLSVREFGPREPRFGAELLSPPLSPGLGQLRVVADVAFAPDAELWFTVRGIDGAALEGTRWQGLAWLRQAAFEQNVEWVDLGPRIERGRVRTTVRIEPDEDRPDRLVAILVYPDLDAGLRLDLRDARPAIRSADVHRAAVEEVAEAARGTELELDDAGAKLTVRLHSRGHARTVLETVVSVTEKVARLWDALVPARQLRGYRGAWLRLARMLGGELDEERGEVIGQIGGIPAAARVGDSSARAHVDFSLPFRIDDPDELARSLPDLVTARTVLPRQGDSAGLHSVSEPGSDNRLRVVLDMGQELGIFDQRLRRLVAALRRYGGSGPFR